jgi:hypothetical protein
VLLLAGLLGFAPGCGRELSEADKKLVADLRAELLETESEIRDAETTDRELGGGLLKALVAVRLEVLRTNKALVEQRIHAVESGAPITVETVSYAPDEKRVADLDAEIARAEVDLLKAQVDASKYAGGLLQALAETAVATHASNVAMLKQARLAAKYGIAAPDAPVSPAAVGRPAPSAPEPQEARLEIVKIDARVTERNSSWSKYAWLLVVKNRTLEQVGFNAKIEFLDRDGFVIDDDSAYNLGLGPGEEQTFRGYSLIGAEIAGNVASVNARVGSGL